MGHRLLKQYQDKRGMDRLGQGCIELVFGASWESYFETKDEVMQVFQVKEDVSPTDKLQTELARAWGGCTIPAHEGQTLRPFIGRTMTEGVPPILPHEDFFKHKVTLFPWADSLKGQL